MRPPFVELRQGAQRIVQMRASGNAGQRLQYSASQRAKRRANHPVHIRRRGRTFAVWQNAWIGRDAHQAAGFPVRRRGQAVFMHRLPAAGRRGRAILKAGIDVNAFIQPDIDPSRPSHANAALHRQIMPA